MEEVLRYAHQFKRREEYRPLEDLAFRVQRVVVETGAEVLNEAGEHEPEPER